MIFILFIFSACFCLSPVSVFSKEKTPPPSSVEGLSLAVTIVQKMCEELNVQETQLFLARKKQSHPKWFASLDKKIPFLSYSSLNFSDFLRYLTRDMKQEIQTNVIFSLRQGNTFLNNPDTHTQYIHSGSDAHAFLYSYKGQSVCIKVPSIVNSNYPFFDCKNELLTISSQSSPSSVYSHQIVILPVREEKNCFIQTYIPHKNCLLKQAVQQNNIHLATFLSFKIIEILHYSCLNWPDARQTNLTLTSTHLFLFDLGDLTLSPSFYCHDSYPFLLLLFDTLLDPLFIRILCPRLSLKRQEELLLCTENLFTDVNKLSFDHSVHSYDTYQLRKIFFLHCINGNYRQLFQQLFQQLENKYLDIHLLRESISQALTPSTFNSLYQQYLSLGDFRDPPLPPLKRLIQCSEPSVPLCSA